MASRKLCWDNAQIGSEGTLCSPSVFLNVEVADFSALPLPRWLAMAERIIRFSALTGSACSLFGDGCVTTPSPRRMRCGDTHLNITLCDVGGVDGHSEIPTRIQRLLCAPHKNERLLSAGAPLSWRVTKTGIHPLLLR